MLSALRRRWRPPSLTRAFSSSSSPHDLRSNTAGLYGFDALRTAKGFRRFVKDAIERSEELISYISRKPPPMEVVRAMDEISNTVCCVVDSAELCRNTHPDREYVEEAVNATVKINDYLHFLNTNHDLYDAVKNIKQEDLSTKEAGRVAYSLRMDFEKGGIHLCADKMDRVNQLSNEISKLAREFNENIAIDPGYLNVFPSSHIPHNLQHLAKPIYRTVPGENEGLLKSNQAVKEKGFRIATDQDSLNSILRWTCEPKIRKMAYITGNSVPHSNLAILDRLIAARHELAQIVGCKSYAEFVIGPNLATSPEVVSSFLHDMSEVVRLKAQQEFATVEEFKRQRTGERTTILEPWDEVYYTGIMKASAYDITSAVVASYFPLSQCIEGLKSLVESLFCASFCSCPLARGESWHPDVMKMSLYHPGEGVLGYLYLDLYSRKGKYPGCAHFAIQGGRRLSETEYQIPVAALICNFSTSQGMLDPLLNHWEVEVLFHEFGHALHSLLSRTDYQHFSGTRVALDLAETPSNLFELVLIDSSFTHSVVLEHLWQLPILENFQGGNSFSPIFARYYAWDYRVLKTFAKSSSGDVIPKKLVDALNGARNMFAATELQRQIYYSIMDQHLFGEEASSARDTVKLVGELKRQYTSWSHVEGTHWHTRFSHLLNYGGGYYSYLYAKCFAATIWQKLCRENPLSPEAGSTLRSNFLQHGGAEDPADLLRRLAGDGILRYQNGGIVPDVSCLRQELHL